MPKMAPESGVPKTEPKPALMPAISRMRRWCGASRSGLESWSASEAPVWIAVPSRPAEPPNRCVRKVPTRTSGVIRSGITSCGSWISSRMRLLPGSTIVPRCLYNSPTRQPAGASSQMSQRWASRSLVANSSETSSSAEAEPARMPTSAEIGIQRNRSARIRACSESQLDNGVLDSGVLGNGVLGNGSPLRYRSHQHRVRASVANPIARIVALG
jgi:hypothetical protein